MYLKLKSVVAKLKGGKHVDLDIKTPLCFLPGEKPHMVEAHLYCDYSHEGLRSLMHMAGQDIQAQVIDQDASYDDDSIDFTAYMVEPEILQVVSHEGGEEGDYVGVLMRYKSIQLDKP